MTWEFKSPQAHRFFRPRLCGGAVCLWRGGAPCNACMGTRKRYSSFAMRATWPVAFTLYFATAILPSSSITNVERITPWTIFP